jgi:hypothetical protein
VTRRFSPETAGTDLFTWAADATRNSQDGPQFLPEGIDIRVVPGRSIVRDATLAEQGIAGRVMVTVTVAQ